MQGWPKHKKNWTGLKKVIKLEKAASGPPTEASETTESVVPSREEEQQKSSLRMVTGDNSYSKE